eukprot:TRINITY_DN3383_c0_g1_i4.p1 TRINITY_DN3383_c0_g1~~TRINITY_DN3383_c0_g1_i4.p1  ORF type:complete len:236 (+),score=44.50 TRINITY_DN3383_c0_g1_i4:95-802(+)
MTTVGEPTASNRDLNSSSERDLNNSSERTWTSATTETLGNVLQAAQDLVYKGSYHVLILFLPNFELTRSSGGRCKQQPWSGCRNCQGVRDQREGPSGRCWQQGVADAHPRSSAGSLKSSPSSEDFEVNAGEPQPSPSLQSPDLRPTQKRARIYISPSPSMSMDSLDMPPPTGLEANLDTALCGPQRLANASPTPPPNADADKPRQKFVDALLRPELIGHKRVDSSEHYWKPTSFE